MTRLVALGALILLAGCHGTAPDQPEPTPNATAPSATATATPAETAGSSLTGQVSGLSGLRTGFTVEITDTATIVALAADTLFAFDKADLSPGAVDNLRKTADLVRQGGDGAVTITGYTDAKGDDAYNLTLSKRRAQAVADWLHAQPGLGGRAFTVVGKGAADPVAPNARPDGSDNPEGRAQNRRVDIIIPKPGA